MKLDEILAAIFGLLVAIFLLGFAIRLPTRTESEQHGRALERAEWMKNLPAICEDWLRELGPTSGTRRIYCSQHPCP